MQNKSNWSLVLDFKKLRIAVAEKKCDRNVLQTHDFLILIQTDVQLEGVVIDNQLMFLINSTRL